MAKYSTVYYSLICSHSGRIDAEYYKPESLQASELVKKHTYLPLGQFVADGYRVVYENTKILNKDQVDEKKDVRFLQATNVSNDGLWIEPSEIGFVSRKDWDKYPKGRIIIGEMLIEVKGQAEKVTIVQDYMPQRTLITGSLFKLSLKKDNLITPEYVFAFFSSKYGKTLRDRTKVNTLISYVSKPELYSIPVPIFINEINKLTSIIDQAFEQSILSHKLYKQAVDLLSNNLNLKTFTICPHKFYSASYYEVINEKRMNAEFFDPVVKDILQLDSMRNYNYLSDLFYIYRGVTPKEYKKSGIPVIKTKNVRIPNIDRKRIEDYVNNVDNSTLTQSGDLLLASMGVGSLGRMSYITEEDEKCIVDGTIRILRKKAGTPDNIQIPVLLFLSTEIGQRLIYRGICGSTGIISLPDDYLAKIPIPQMNREICNRLTDLVLKSIEARKESTLLLDKAKAKIEELIETT